MDEEFDTNEIWLIFVITMVTISEQNILSENKIFYVEMLLFQEKIFTEI